VDTPPSRNTSVSPAEDEAAIVDRHIEVLGRVEPGQQLVVGHRPQASGKRG
jgi:hypothetical protein